MTPQEYIDREHSNARSDIGWAKSKNDDASIQGIEEEPPLLNNKVAIRLMRAAEQALTKDEDYLREDATTKIVAKVDGIEYTLPGIILSLRIMICVWEWRERSKSNDTSGIH